MYLAILYRNRSRPMPSIRAASDWLPWERASAVDTRLFSNSSSERSRLNSSAPDASISRSMTITFPRSSRCRSSFAMTLFSLCIFRNCSAGYRQRCSRIWRSYSSQAFSTRVIAAVASASTSTGPFCMRSCISGIVLEKASAASSNVFRKRFLSSHTRIGYQAWRSGGCPQNTGRTRLAKKSATRPPTAGGRSHL